jgi:hypothetical protein
MSVGLAVVVVAEPSPTHRIHRVFVFADTLKALVTHFAVVAGAFAQFRTALCKFMLMHCRTQQLAVVSLMLDFWSLEALV